MQTDAPRRPRHFASDNNSGICPEVWAALAEANAGHAPGYGDDPWTARACELIRDLFQTDCEVFFVFNGTAANALALAAICRPFHAVLSHEAAHIVRDECGAPEFFSGGAKLWTLPGRHGKLDPESIDAAVRSHFPLHASKPGAVSITQATESGTVYSVAEVTAIAAAARRHALKLHMDGARFANAVASLRVAPAEVTWRAGVDILSLGATKNGGLGGDAVVIFDHGLAREFEYRVKQAGQLASKMRFMAATWVGLLGSGAWQRNAEHANSRAALLEREIAGLPAARLLHPREANGLFVDLPRRLIEALHTKGWRFYVFEGDTGCRLMCSWDTTEDDVRDFVADAKARAGVLGR